MARRTASRPKTTDPAEPSAPKAKRTRAPKANQTPAGPTTAEPTPDDIRRRAYERYQARGGNHGQHFDDWLEAEKELRTKK